MGLWEKNQGPRTITLQQKIERCPSKLVTFSRCLAEVARAEGDCMSRSKRVPAPGGGGSYCAPHPVQECQALGQLP